ncbi:puroindoline-B [Brachypodium distachyon]|uniref:Bifunctional inhibitor/plant lipid transfer protein/seed storage helical domain-containing protein n=1 Tax=Brachypodium distachyon TaxID=15368 RepID=I1IH95_BRADI|nr:puroindoline-B [Brachypodium distachyon]KQJ86201.1 hypothetical protein BRADI_4g03950v3 [Brachypodium distachyon]|eukprot:XP_003578775.1 puroindoline-B [Brachypodium distachyon]
MKITFFLLALLALVASATAFSRYADVRTGQDPHVRGDKGISSEQQCHQEQMKLDSCKDYVTERCTLPGEIPFTKPYKWGKGSCQEVKNQCCQELEKTSSECRCKAVWKMIEGELGGFWGVPQSQVKKVLQAAKNLPSMCNKGEACDIPVANGYYYYYNY